MCGRVVGEQRTQLHELRVELGEGELVGLEVFRAAREQKTALAGLGVAHHGQRALERELDVLGVHEAVARVRERDAAR